MEMAIHGLEEFDARQFTILNWVIWAVAMLFTLLRLVVRYVHLQRFFWDDTFAILGFICLTAMAILNQTSRDAIYLIESLSSGAIPVVPYNAEEMIVSTIRAELMMQFFIMMLFWCCLWSVKASLLMFYRRLFGGLDGYMKWWWAVVGVCLLTWLISILTNVMDCLPFWRRFTLNAEDLCLSSHGANAIYVATSIDVLSDVLVAILPIRLLIGLRINMRQKIGIGAIFSLGIVVVIFSIIRMVKVSKSIANLNPKYNVSLALWSMLEASVAVIIGCLPTLKALIARKRDTYYGYSGQKITPRNGTKIASNTSQVPQGPHIRLCDVRGGTTSTVKGGYGSDEALNTNIEGRGAKGGITKTHEVTVSSLDIGRARREASLDSFRDGH